jgi:hypothetical protein
MILSNVNHKQHHPPKLRVVKNISICHLERVRGSEATKDESKDPESTSAAMPHQGIIPKLLLSGKQMI